MEEGKSQMVETEENAEQLEQECELSTAGNSDSEQCSETEGCSAAEIEVGEGLNGDESGVNVPAAEELPAVLEALILAYGEPLAVATMATVTGAAKDDVERALESVGRILEERGAGFRLVNVGGKYHFRTNSEFAPYIQKLKAGRPRKLTTQALETLAIIAYRQPIVRNDIEKIRGVDASPTLKTLLERKLIKIVGHQDTVGQPALFGTTDEFLNIFGLSSLRELPTLRDLKELDVPSDEADASEADDGEERMEQLAEASSPA